MSSYRLPGDRKNSQLFCKYQILLAFSTIQRVTLTRTFKVKGISINNDAESTSVNGDCANVIQNTITLYLAEFSQFYNNSFFSKLILLNQN